MGSRAEEVAGAKGLSKQLERGWLGGDCSFSRLSLGNWEEMKSERCTHTSQTREAPGKGPRFNVILSCAGTTDHLPTRMPGLSSEQQQECAGHSSLECPELSPSCVN